MKVTANTSNRTLSSLLEKPNTAYKHRSRTGDSPRLLRLHRSRCTTFSLEPFRKPSMLSCPAASIPRPTAANKPRPRTTASISSTSKPMPPRSPLCFVSTKSATLRAVSAKGCCGSPCAAPLYLFTQIHDVKRAYTAKHHAIHGLFPLRGFFPRIPSRNFTSLQPESRFRHTLGSRIVSLCPPTYKLPSVSLTRKCLLCKAHGCEALSARLDRDFFSNHHPYAFSGKCVALVFRYFWVMTADSQLCLLRLSGPSKTEKITFGCLTNGALFDGTFSRGKQAAFPLSEISAGQGIKSLSMKVKKSTPYWSTNLKSSP